MGYRSPAAPGSADIEAAGELNRRMTRLRLRVMVPGFALALIGAGLTLGPAIEAGSGRGDPTIGATFLVTITVIAGLAWGLYRALATLLQPRWIAEIAERYGIPAGELMITMAPYREERITLAGPLRALAYLALGLVLTALLVTFVVVSVRGC